MSVLAACTALALAGALASALGGHAVARSEADKARLAFHLSSAEIASTLKLAIQHEEDLIVSASAFVTGNPAASAADFDRWAESVHAIRRYPELQNIGLVKLVPSSGLAAFLARLKANPVRPLGPQTVGPSGNLQILPPGQRPYYCFAVAGLARSAASYIPSGADYCALAPQLIAGRDSGHASYAPFISGMPTTLGVSTPVYRGGVVPPTVTARRRAFVGWLGELLLPNVVVQRALEGHPNIAIMFRYDVQRSHVGFASGRRPSGAQRTTIDLRNGWTVQSFGPGVSGGIFANWHALALALGGTVSSLLVALLLLVLATARRRALSLVREKTRELSHQALHDALTGLPNRALVLDRAEQLLARMARQSGSVVGALFIDIDGFKHINDNLGHAAGDELLTITAERLRRTMRTQDTAGRFGGDEFVVLVESAGAELTAAMLAERLTEVLREPAELEGGQQIVSVTASIGIAVGRYASADALLRDADVALYFAKAAGKNRCAIFEASMNAGVEDRQVLIADDDEINRSVARALLAKRGLRATIAHNGLEAVRMAGERNYAAILMDCQMPELDGYEATRRIRAAEHGHRAPVIAMTAHSMPGDRERCLAAGMDDYLSKPVRNENLDAVLERWLVGYEPALRPAQRAARPANGGGDRKPAGTGSSSQAPAKRSTSDAEADPGGAEEVLDQATVSQLRDTLTVEMRERLMQTFEQSLSTCVADIAGAVSRGDHNELRRLAHFLKGSSATLGARRLSVACQRLQHAGREQDASVGEEQLQALELAAEEAREALRRELVGAQVRAGAP